MSEEKMRFKPLGEGQEYNCPTGYWWVGHPNCDRPDADEKMLIDNRDKLWFIDGISDPDACYSYDEYALVKLGRTYYMCHTSGCSCPSPSETWIVIASGSKKEALTSTLENNHVPDWSRWAIKWLRGHIGAKS